MNRVKNHFSIKNLEQLSGIKAHTIRIWEKRYNLFEPERTDTNIRTYNLQNLQKLLNVRLLYNNGFKISKIADFSEEKITQIVHDLSFKKNSDDWSLGLFKLAMINFDQALFTKTFNDLLKHHSVSTIFQNIFIPFMYELGVLWQTNSISPSHEHFVTSLIKQKVHSLIEDLQKNNPTNTTKSFVLFLPDNEIHELGILYLNYEVLLKGYKSIFLGQSVPIESLSNLSGIGDNIHFVSSFTIEPIKENINDYLSVFEEKILHPVNGKLWLVGYQTQFIDGDLHPNVNIFDNLNHIIKHL